MKNLSFREVLGLILIGILLAGVGFLTYKTLSVNKRAKVLSKENYYLKHLKADTLIVRDSVMLPGRTVIKPIPIKFFVHDSIFVSQRELFYDSTFRGKGWRFRYRIKAIGEVSELSFSDFVVPRDVITITRSIDTCFSKSLEYKAKMWHLGVYTEIQASNFNEFPGIGLGGQVVIFDRLTIGLGGVYDKVLKGNLRIGVLF
jgi:hypothetical protein